MDATYLGILAPKDAHARREPNGSPLNSNCIEIAIGRTVALLIKCH